jgi:hypothetical protein
MATKGRVLSAVPLAKWLIIYSVRSGRQASEFIAKIASVCPISLHFHFSFSLFFFLSEFLLS